MIYFIHGPDRLLARDAARRVALEHDPDGANTSWLDGREATLESVKAAVGTVSFFGGRRVVVISDLLGKASRGSGQNDSGENERSRSGKAQSPLAPLAEAVPEDHCLILLEPDMIAPPAALKTAAPGATVIAGQPPRGAALLAWIAESAAGAGSTIDRRAAQLLAESLYPQTWDRKPNNPRYDRPPDMSLLSQELEKLALSAHPGPITADHVRDLVPGGPDQRVFRFLDAALSGDLRTASVELDRLQSAGEEPAMVLAQALGQIELSAIAREAGGRDAATLARDMGSVTASRMSAIMASARRQPVSAAHNLDAGVSADRRLKTGRLRRPADALHDLVLGLAEGAAQRKTGRSS